MGDDRFNDRSNDRSNDPPRIAIVGMAGRFPGAANVGEFWTNLRDGIESITFFTPEELRERHVDAAWLNNPNFVPALPEVAERELFDAGFFGYSAQEAEIIDPQQRLFLETAWEALEDAGCVPARTPGLVGIYAGSSQNTYLWFNLLTRAGFLARHGVLRTIVGNGSDYLATRTAHKLDLRGPALTVQTACSTSLVAIHLACQGLLNFECDVALAGGVSLRVTPLVGYLYESGGLLSRDGHCRAFSAGAGGTVFGDGVGVVTLKRLEDAERDGDTIRAVILGSAVNNDGSQKAGFTAPAPAGQAAVVFQALENAAVSADSISYVEAHGTGTEIGDPIEVHALTTAFGASTKRRGFCAIGSLKTNVGHLDAASGIAGIIKTALALQHRQLPPTLHFDRPNPEIDFDATPFFVNGSLRDWTTDGGPRRAGVHAFGIGGTNAHVVVEEAPAARPSSPPRESQLIVISARSAAALAAAAAQLAAVADTWSPDAVADAAYTLSTGRRAFPHRRAVVGRTGSEIAAQLESRSSGAFVAASDHDRHLVELATQWMAGGDIDWDAFWAGERRRRIPLPTYPFERKRYWSEPDEGQASQAAHTGPLTSAANMSASHPRPALDTPHVAPRTAREHVLVGIWTELLGTSGIGVDDNFFELGGDSLVATQLIARLRSAFGHEWTLRELMTHATVAQLSAAIDARATAPASADAALLAEIDSLTDEEAEARLRTLLGPADR